MSDQQYAPLTAAVVRTLTDKVYEKRKAAALDIERQVNYFIVEAFKIYLLNFAN